MSDTYPLLEVLNANGEAVNVVVWHIRAICEAKVRGRTVTRIEYANGDTLDLDPSENATAVIERFYEAAERPERGQ